VTPGDCFRGKSTDRHLQVVLAGATDRHIVCVNATSFGSQLDGDRSCVLRKGDHPAIVHDSCIVYERARLVSIADIQRGLRVGLLETLAKLQPEILARIVAGALESENTPGFVISILLGTNKS
jgi:hypothetical protein